MTPQDERQDDRKEALRLALGFLAARSHSIEELRRKLLRHGAKAAPIEEVLRELQRRGLLDDEALCEQYVAGILRRKPYGKRWFKARLLKKEIDGAIVDRVLTRIYEEHDEYSLAYAAAGEHLRRHRGSGPSVMIKKIVRFLQNRGFPDSVIAQVLRERLSEEMSGDDVDWS